jgi:hypothetical protein
MPNYNPERFEQFSVAYRNGLHEAVMRNPQDYAVPPGRTAYEFASIVSEKMLLAIKANGIRAVLFTQPGFRNACKSLGIKHTGKAMTAFLEG